MKLNKKTFNENAATFPFTKMSHRKYPFDSRRHSAKLDSKITMAISDMKTKETMEKRITESFRNGDESSYYYRFEYYFLTGLDKSNRCGYTMW